MRRDLPRSSPPGAGLRGGLILTTVLLGACAASPSSEPQPGSGGTTVSSSGGSKGSGGSTGSSSGGATGSGSGGSGTPSSTCTPGTVMTGTLTMPFDYVALNASAPDGHQYYLQVNEWNSAANMAPQTILYGGDYFFKITQQMGKVATNGGPVGFPSHFIGSNGGRTTARSNLPKAVSALTTVPTSWTWDDGGTLSDNSNNSYNATYDVWFSSPSTGDPDSPSAPSGGYLMVWYHKPSDAQPIGSIKYSGVSIPGVDGTWNVWIGNNGTKPCISYVASKDVKSLSYDLNLFIKDAVQNRSGTIQSGWALTNVFAGFEIWRGGVGLQSTSFCAVVN